MNAPSIVTPPADLLEQIAAARTIRARKQIAAASGRFVTPDEVTGLCRTVLQQVRTDAQQALAIANFALGRALRLRDALAVPECLRAKANALYSVGRHRLAIAYHERAIRLFGQAGAELEIGKTLSSSLQPRLLLGEYDAAFSAAECARDIFTRHGQQSRLARLDINVGNIYHRQDRFEEAVASYERAHAILSQEGDAEAVAVILHNLAVCLVSLNDFRRAMSTYEQGRAFAVEHAMPRLVAQADYNIAWLYYQRGQYSRAIELLRDTREACLRSDDQYHYALCHLDLSEIYLELNLSEDALQIAEQGALLFQQLGMGYEQGKCIANHAIALGQQGKAFRALELFQQARDILVREKNAVWPHLIDLYQALLLFSERRYYEANRLCSSALDFFQNSFLSGKTVLCLLLKARIELAIGDVSLARAHCERAVALLEQLDSPVLNYQAHFLLGEIRLRSGDKRSADQEVQSAIDAYASYQTARDALERLRTHLRGEELKIAFMKNRLQVYENLVELCLWRRSDPLALEEAFCLIEQAKSRTMLDLLMQAGTPAPADSGESELVRSIRDLREELNWYYHRIEVEQLRPEQNSVERLRHLEDAARSRERELMRVLRETPDARIREAGVEPPPTFSLAAIREALPANTTLLEYYRVKDQILAAVVTRDRLEIQPVTLISRVEKLIRLLQFQMSKFRLGEQYTREFSEPLLAATNDHLRELYRELIEPVQMRLEGTRLVVVPHDVLHHVPFHALFSGKAYLTDLFELTFAPSASVFKHCMEDRQTGEGLAVFGVPDGKAPAIESEARAIAAMVDGAQLFLGSQATKMTLEDAASRSRAVHIATHGHFRQDNPMFSGIRMGDGYLSLYDLYQLKLPVALLSLTGCSTGMNVVAAGDELLGLVRGLFYAGASTLLVSLWEVNDASTTEFAKLFYSEYLQSGHPASAWRHAMQTLRAEYPHPYYWAPFALVGRPSS